MKTTTPEEQQLSALWNPDVKLTNKNRYVIQRIIGQAFAVCQINAGAIIFEAESRRRFLMISAEEPLDSIVNELRGKGVMGPDLIDGQCILLELTGGREDVLRSIRYTVIALLIRLARYSDAPRSSKDKSAFLSGPVKRSTCEQLVRAANERLKATTEASRDTDTLAQLRVTREQAEASLDLLSPLVPSMKAVTICLEAEGTAVEE